MTVHIVEDYMMDKFKAGDIVRFNLDEQGIYSCEVPKFGTIGYIESQTHSFPLEQALGVQIPMSIVKWQTGRKSAVFCHDIEKIEVNHSQSIDLISKIKSINTYTDKN